MEINRNFYQDSGSGYQPPPPPPPPPYGNTQPMGSTPSPQGQMGGSASSNSIIVLILGILSWIACGIIAAIPAWIMGKSELNKIAAGQSPYAGKTMATIGMWLGIIQVILAIIAIIVLAILFAFGVFTSLSDFS